MSMSKEALKMPTRKQFGRALHGATAVAGIYTIGSEVGKRNTAKKFNVFNERENNAITNRFNEFNKKENQIIGRAAYAKGTEDAYNYLKKHASVNDINKFKVNADFAESNSANNGTQPYNGPIAGGMTNMIRAIKTEKAKKRNAIASSNTDLANKARHIKSKENGNVTDFIRSKSISAAATKATEAANTKRINDAI